MSEDRRVVRGQPSDRTHIIDFGDYVFSRAHMPTDYAALLPRLYGADADTSGYHYLVKDEAERIRALILSFPYEVRLPDDWQADGEPFRLNGIGTVSVHPRDRGAGHMRKLMADALRDMQETMVVASLLSGQRQRYRYYGYETAGAERQALISRRALSMTWPECESWGRLRGWHVEDLIPGHRHERRARALYAAQHPVDLRGEESLADILASYGCKTKLLYYRNRLLAYAQLTEGGEGRLTEVACDPDLIAELGEEYPVRMLDAAYQAYPALRPLGGWPALLWQLLQLLDREQIELRMPLNCWARLPGLMETVQAVSEEQGDHTGQMLLVLDWGRFLGLLLADRIATAGTRESELPEGELRLHVSERPLGIADEISRIRWLDGRLQVFSGGERVVDLSPGIKKDWTEDSTSSHQMPVHGELRVTQAQAVDLLLNPLSFNSGLHKLLLPPEIASWFPLDPTLPLGDRV